MGKRFYLFEMTDLWMIDFETPGTRTAGGAAANYLLTGPGWSGTVPEGMKQIKSATRYLVILGRTYADGTYAATRSSRPAGAAYKLTPLSAWGKPFTPTARQMDPNPGFRATAKPQEVINAMDTSANFNKMATLMCKDAPRSGRRCGNTHVDGQDWPGALQAISSITKLDPAVQAALKDTGKAGIARIEANQAHMGEIVNGWTITKGVKNLRHGNYLKRATVAPFSWPANRQEDAVYLPLTFVDSTGRKAQWSKQVHADFRQGRDAAGQRLLVDHYVRDR